MNNKLVIVPTYNEKENLDLLLDTIFTANPDIHVLFVDDNSPDGTGDILDGKAETDQRIHILHRSHKQGLGRAYIAGFKWALEHEYQFICEMDADLSHDPKALPDLFNAAEEADLILGSRYVGGIRIINWPLSRLFLSKGAGVYVRLLTGMPFTDPTGGFKCFRRKVLENIPLDEVRSTGYSFQIEMTHRAWMKGFKVDEVPIIFEERRSGVSKMDNKIISEALLVVWSIVIKNKLRRKPRQDHHPDSVAGSTNA